jgi:hypothetical protein
MKFYQILALVILIFTSSCVKNKNGIPVATNQMATVEKVFEVNEVVQTSSYTYLKVDENSEDRWVAVSRMDAKKGDKYYYDEALLMNNFHSKELDRDFETIYFVNKVSTIPFSVQDKMASMPSGHSGKATAQKGSSISIEKADGELTVGKIFENKTKYSEKEIEISGIVVKVNKEVMGKNWVHIQDGSKYNESFDLTITTMDLPSINDEVTFKGTIILDKDFGAGYFYDVIMEDAKLLKTQKPASQM